MLISLSEMTFALRCCSVTEKIDRHLVLKSISFRFPSSSLALFASLFKYVTASSPQRPICSKTRGVIVCLFLYLSDLCLSVSLSVSLSVFLSVCFCMRACWFSVSLLLVDAWFSSLHQARSINFLCSDAPSSFELDQNKTKIWYARVQ